MLPASKTHPPLHNFPLPALKWGNQRLLRCRKQNLNRQIPNTSPDRGSPPSDAESVDHTSPDRSASFHRPFKSSPHEKLRTPPPHDGIEEIRAKLVDHLRTAADRMKYKVPEDGEENDSTSAAVAALRPWNLRTRRAACEAPAETGNHRLGSLQLRGSAGACAVQDVKRKNKDKERKKFSISLLRDEIEEDFLAITGSKPLRRPKKRAKMLQRQLDAIFPGSWLCEITPDIYKTSDFHESCQR